MSKHTPGPWHVANVGWIASERGTICAMYAMKTGLHGEDIEGEANARLIAAAPDLLDALKAAQEELRLIRMKDTNAVYDVLCRSQISAAIAKAEGRQ